MNYVIDHQLTLVTQECGACGVVFAWPQQLKDELLRTRRDWYCPNGHVRHFIVETEEERLRKRVHQIELENTRLANEVETKEKTLAKALREQKRMKTRVAAGVCPCCNRTFQQLARHMKTKHPEHTS